jgi:N-acetylglucosaminyl-diphospho-decaprenol L-rhamnosyltransferase
MPSVDSPLLSVIVINHNGEKWLPECLDSLASVAAGIPHEVILVDNGSQDASLQLLARAYPHVRVIANTTNRGFAAANNQGIAQARGRCILLLNTDTRFEHGLAEMVRFLDEHPRCAAVGPSMLDGTGRPRASWGHFPTPRNLATTMLLLDRIPLLRRWTRPLLVQPGTSHAHASAHPVDWISGACMAIPRAALDEIGLLDDHHFMYGEDVDWCYRAWQRGYQIWVTPAARIVHYGAGGSEWRRWKGTAPTVRWYAHVLYFYEKHYGPGPRLLARILILLGAFVRWLLSWWLRLSARGADSAHAAEVTAAYGQVVRMALARSSMGGHP